jgi:hypothetical protein
VTTFLARNDKMESIVNGPLVKYLMIIGNFVMNRMLKKKKKNNQSNAYSVFAVGKHNLAFTIRFKFIFSASAAIPPCAIQNHQLFFICA